MLASLPPLLLFLLYLQIAVDGAVAAAVELAFAAAVDGAVAAGEGDVAEPPGVSRPSFHGDVDFHHHHGAIKHQGHR